MKKLYLAGPMSGLPDLNFPAFNAEAARLRALGFEVANPAEVNAEHPDMPYMWYIKQDLCMMLTCEFVAFLPNWYNSKGANKEYSVARILKMPCIDAQTIIAPAPFSVGKKARK